MALSERNLFMLFLLLSLYLVEPRYFRLISAAMYAVKESINSLNNSAQFITLTGFPLDVFQARIVADVAPILIYTRESSDAWLSSNML